MSINICKECGREFEAKSPRIAYCPDVHYRPCPICGTPVEAKYLSDPARRCENCKGKSVPKMKPPTVKPSASISSLASSDFSSGEVRKYVGHPLLGFLPGHLYEIEYTWNHTRYDVSATKDVTEGKAVDLFISLSSQISIDRMFARIVTH